MVLIVLALLLLVRAVRDATAARGCSRRRRRSAWRSTSSCSSRSSRSRDWCCSPTSACAARRAGASGGSRSRALVYVAVALSWLTATLLVPAHDRPWAIGSTNGSAWNAAFVFNGTDRLGGKSVEPRQHDLRRRATTTRRRRSPSATASRSCHRPPRGCSRASGRCRASGSASRSSSALLLGIPALFLGLRLADPARSGRRRTSPAPAAAGAGAPLATVGAPAGAGGLAGAPGAGSTPEGTGGAPRASAGAAAVAGPQARPGPRADTPAGPVPHRREGAGEGSRREGDGANGAGSALDEGAAAQPAIEDREEMQERMRRASAIGLSVWMLCGIVLFSDMARLHPRYVEGFTPGRRGDARHRRRVGGGAPRAGRAWWRSASGCSRPSTTPSGCCIGTHGDVVDHAAGGAGGDRVRAARAHALADAGHCAAGSAAAGASSC